MRPNMTKIACRSFLAAFFGLATVLNAVPASAQYLNLTPTVVDDVPAVANQPAETFTAPRPSLFKPFTDALGDFRHLPDRTNAAFLVVGLAAAAGAHKAAADVTEDFGGTRNGLCRPGATSVGPPFRLGQAFATFSIARS